MFSDTTEAATVGRKCHPVDLVIQAFKDDETRDATIDRLRVFLEEAMRVHGKKFEFARRPVSWFFPM